MQTFHHPSKFQKGVGAWSTPLGGSRHRYTDDTLLVEALVELFGKAECRRDSTEQVKDGVPFLDHYTAYCCAQGCGFPAEGQHDEMGESILAQLHHSLADRVNSHTHQGG